MNTVLLGGSRSISRLAVPVQDRIENIVSQGFEILIGDANGADRVFQAHLASRGYKNVTVFCSGNACRNNVGNWKVTFVQTGRVKLDFEHYAQKDAQMASKADYGLFLWNGKSRGTLNSVRMLLERGRPVLVYISPKKSFVTLKKYRDLQSVMGRLGIDVPSLHKTPSKRGAKPLAQRSLFS